MKKLGKIRGIWSKKRDTITTLREILAQDDVNTLLGELDQHRHEIEDMIVICVDCDGLWRLLSTPMTDKDMVFLFEDVKFSVLLNERED